MVIFGVGVLMPRGANVLKTIEMSRHILPFIVLCLFLFISLCDAKATYFDYEQPKINNINSYKRKDTGVHSFYNGLDEQRVVSNELDPQIRNHGSKRFLDQQIRNHGIPKFALAL